MTKGEFYTALESMLEMEAGSIRGDEVLKELPGWDSMAVLSFIAWVDSNLDEVISPKDLASSRTVEDLIKLCMGKIT